MKIVSPVDMGLCVPVGVYSRHVQDGGDHVVGPYI